MPTSFAREPLLMPTSGFQLVCNKEPFMYNNDLTRVDVAKVNLPEGGSLDGFTSPQTNAAQNASSPQPPQTSTTSSWLKSTANPSPCAASTWLSPTERYSWSFDAPKGAKIDKTAEDLNESIEIAHKIND